MLHSRWGKQEAAGLQPLGVGCLPPVSCVIASEGEGFALSTSEQPAGWFNGLF